jgi:hypothetical protein
MLKMASWGETNEVRIAPRFLRYRISTSRSAGRVIALVSRTFSRCSSMNLALISLRMRDENSRRVARVGAGSNSALLSVTAPTRPPGYFGSSDTGSSHRAMVHRQSEPNVSPSTEPEQKLDIDW